MSFCVVVMSKAYRGVPSVKQPGAGDPAQQEMRGPGPASAGGGEERRVRRGPDIQRPLDVRDPVCQSAVNGETHEHRRRHIPVCPCARRVARMRRERDI